MSQITPRPYIREHVAHFDVQALGQLPLPVLDGHEQHRSALYEHFEAIHRQRPATPDPEDLPYWDAIGVIRDITSDLLANTRHARQDHDRW